MRMVTSKDIEELAEQINIAFKRMEKRVAALEDEPKAPKAVAKKKDLTKD
tara:strand:+ start:345 stop:494 length:150 start_codon:yes stop_codon:yes gene_type:complete